MSDPEKQSTREKGRVNADKLAEWVESTSLSAIPLNQYGVASRSKICKSLGITLSTVGSNKAIQQMFTELDARLGTGPRPEAESLDQGAVRHLQQRISR